MFAPHALVLDGGCRLTAIWLASKTEEWEGRHKNSQFYAKIGKFSDQDMIQSEVMLVEVLRFHRAWSTLLKTPAVEKR